MFLFLILENLFVVDKRVIKKSHSPMAYAYIIGKVCPNGARIVARPTNAQLKA